MKEVTLIISCDCGYRIERVFYTNEYGYFEIPEAACPDCFNVLMHEIKELPKDITEVAKNIKGT